MRNRFRGKDYLAFKDMTREEIEFIVDLSLLESEKFSSLFLKTIRSIFLKKI